MTVLVDTNIFLEVLLHRQHGDACKLFLQHVREGRRQAIVTDYAIHSIFAILDNAQRTTKLNRFLTSLPNHEGLDVIQTTVIDKARSVTLSEEQEMKLEDALQYRTAEKQNVDAIISLDSDFDELEIPRKTPSEVLE